MGLLQPGSFRGIAIYLLLADGDHSQAKGAVSLAIEPERLSLDVNAGALERV